MVVSFEDVTPLARYDNRPWTIATVQESASQNGPWADIEQFVLNPVDADPKNPLPRNFTTEQATLTSGWYRIVFTDATGDQQSPTFPILNLSYTPTLAKVGTIAMSRTVDDVGNVLGTFTSQTRPTDVTVRKLISRALDDIVPEIGTDIPEDLIDKAANLVALRAAMLIELTLYANEIRNDLSPYKEYEALYNKDLASIQSEISAEESGGDPRDQLSGTQPSYWFPDSDEFFTRPM